MEESFDTISRMMDGSLDDGQTDGSDGQIADHGLD